MEFDKTTHLTLESSIILKQKCSWVAGLDDGAG